MDKQPSFLDSLKENLPVISAFLLILGSIRLSFFYSYFGIDITSYIDLSETVSLSLTFFTKTAMILIPFCFFFLPSAVTMNYEASGISDFHLSSEGKKITITQLVTGLSMNVLLFLILYFMFTGYLDFTVTTDMILIFPFVFIIYFLSRTISKSQILVENALNKKISDDFFALLSILFYSSIFTIALARHSARNIEFGKIPVYAEVQLDSSFIHSSNSYRYIGKTKNFVFFLNTKTSKSDAIPLTNLKRLTVVDDHSFNGVLLKDTIPH